MPETLMRARQLEIKTHHTHTQGQSKRKRTVEQRSGVWFQLGWRCSAISESAVTGRAVGGRRRWHCLEPSINTRQKTSAKPVRRPAGIRQQTTPTPLHTVRTKHKDIANNQHTRARALPDGGGQTREQRRNARMHLFAGVGDL
jgi:hypothetical protein